MSAPVISVKHRLPEERRDEGSLFSSFLLKPLGEAEKSSAFVLNIGERSERDPSATLGMTVQKDSSLCRSNKGFTLIEMVFSFGILAIVISGLLSAFVNGSRLARHAGEASIAMTQAQMKLEEIKNHPYSLITTDYVSMGTPGPTFSLINATGMGLVSISTANSEYLEVDVKVSWQDDAGRIIGEDLDLDGVLDDGEDANGNGELDSPLTLTTYIANL